MAITVFTKDGCRDCDRTKDILDSKGVVYDVLNAQHDPEAFDFVVNVIGVKQMPVVIIHDDDWRDFRPEQDISGIEQPYCWSGIRYDRLAGLETLLEELEQQKVAA